MHQLEMYAILDRSEKGIINRLLLKVRAYSKFLSPTFQDALMVELQNKHDEYLEAYPVAQKL